MSTTRCAVLGTPIGHSLSPVLHRAAYDALGLAWTYEAIEMDEDGLPDFLAGLDDVVARAVAHDAAQAPRAAAARLGQPDRRGRRGRQHGAAGRRAAGSATTPTCPGRPPRIRERYDGRVRTAVVVGGGATAASVALALGELGCLGGHAAGARRGAGRGHGAARDPQRGTAARGRVARGGAARGRHRGLDDPRRGADPRPRGSPGRHPGRLRRRLRDLADAPGALGRPRPRRWSADSTCSCTRRRCRWP